MGSESKGRERKATILRVGKRKNYGTDPITRDKKDNGFFCLVPIGPSNELRILQSCMMEDMGYNDGVKMSGLFFLPSPFIFTLHCNKS